MQRAEAGANQRVAIANDVVLDFGGLFDQARASEKPVQPPLESEAAAPKRRPKTAPAGDMDVLERQQAKQLFLQADRAKEEHQRNEEIFQTYQTNIKKSSQLQREILKGVKNGESIYDLFLKAAEAISLMTSNRGFADQIGEDLKTIYGRGLHEEQPLQTELQDAQKRLQRLEEAEAKETDQQNKKRLQRAIQAHRGKIEELTDLIKEAKREREETQI